MLKTMAKDVKNKVHMKTHIHLEDLDLNEDELHKVGELTLNKMCSHDKAKL